MAHLRLFLSRELSIRFAQRLVPEKRIVAEAAVASARSDYFSRASSYCSERFSVRKRAGNSGYEPSGSFAVRYFLDSLEKLVVILFVVARLTRISCGLNAGLSAESVYTKSRIVGNGDISEL